MTTGLILKGGRPARRKHPEADLQAAVCKYLRDRLTDETWFGAVPLGGGGALRGVGLRRTGSQAGTPDLLLIHAGRAFWLELKAPGGSLSDKQLYQHRKLHKSGCMIFTCRSVDDVEYALWVFKIPVKARVAA